MQKEELLVILCELYKECMTIKQVFCFFCFFPPIFLLQVLLSCRLVFSYSRIVRRVHDHVKQFYFCFYFYLYAFIFTCMLFFFAGMRPKSDGFLQGSKKVQKIVGRQKRQERQGQKRQKRKGKYFGANK